MKYLNSILICQLETGQHCRLDLYANGVQILEGNKQLHDPKKIVNNPLNLNEIKEVLLAAANAVPAPKEIPDKERKMDLIELIQDFVI